MNNPEIVLCGNLAAKPEMRAVGGDGAVVVAKLRVAVTPRRRDRATGEWSDGETMWFGVSTWRQAAVNCVASLNQGDRVLVRGRLSQRTWTDDAGVDRPTLVVDAEDVALDLSRHAAMSLRGRPPAQREPGPEDAEVGDDTRPGAGPGAAGSADAWVSTGQVDEETGEVLLVPREALVDSPVPA